MNGNKEHYTKYILEQINELKPDTIHGVYNFDLIRYYERLLKKIKSF